MEAPVGPRVGVFDSGVGGLSVWREIVHQHPQFETHYVADQAHVPYGARPALEILDFARGLSRFLAARGCTILVVACNTASAVALQSLRAEFPDLHFVGMEPAIKPAAALSRRRVIGVLATPATLNGELLATSTGRFAGDARVIRQPCPGLVECIESGEVEGDRVESMLRDFLRDPLQAGADTFVLACTHYPFVRDAIARIAGPGVQVIDPAPAVARQVGRLAARAEPTAPGSGRGRHCFWTSGDVAEFERVGMLLLARRLRARSLEWAGPELGLVEPASGRVSGLGEER